MHTDQVILCYMQLAPDKRGYPDNISLRKHVVGTH